MNEKLKSIKLIVSGRVQGVGFRYFTRQTAVDCNITGFVKNENDRTVKIEATGSENNLNIFIGKCYKGPAFARVDNIEIQEIPLKTYDGFEIR